MYKVTFAFILTALTISATFGQRKYDAVRLPEPGGANGFSFPAWISDDGSKMIGRSFFPWGPGGKGSSSGSAGQCYRSDNGVFTPLPTPGFVCGISTANSKGDFGGILSSTVRDSVSNAIYDNWYAYGYFNGQFIPFKSLLPGQPDKSEVSGINEKGDIVGSGWTEPHTVTFTGLGGEAVSYTDYRRLYGFVYSAGQVRQLPTLGGHGSAANGINDAGDVAGWASLADPGLDSFPREKSRAVIFHGDQIVDLGLPDGISSSAYSINNKGQVAGWLQPETPQSTTWPPLESFYYDGANIVTIPKVAGAPDTSWMRAFHISDAGEVTGIYSASDTPQRPFYYYKGTSYDVNSLVRNLPAGVVLVQVTYVAPDGKMIAIAKNLGDLSLAPAGNYLLTPVGQLSADTAGGDSGQQTGTGTTPPSTPTDVAAQQ